MKLQDTLFYMRERDDSIGGDNPFKWSIKRTSDLFTNKRVLVVGLPGAFTPTCSNSQLPGFEVMYDKFIESGVDEIYCTAVNDAFVMYQWAKSLGIEKVKMLPDGNGDFAIEMGMLVGKNNLGFGDRSWRYAAIIDDCVVQEILAEEGQMENCPDDPYEVSTPENVLDYIKENF